MYKQSCSSIVNAVKGDLNGQNIVRLFMLGIIFGDSQFKFHDKLFIFIQLIIDSYQ